MTRTVCIFNRTRESFLCLSAIASGDTIRFRKLAREDGIWLTGFSSVYAVGSGVPVDRVYLDQGNRVIQLVEHLHPLEIVRVHGRYASLLEVRTRTIYSSLTQVGDELLICSPDQVETRWKQIRKQIQESSQVPNPKAKTEVIACSKG